MKPNVAETLAPQPQPGETLDAVCRGQVQLFQRRDGYRFSVDPILLAAFVGKPRGATVDLGTGSGILALLMARRGAKKVLAIEAQPGLAGLARRNVALNRLDDRVQVFEGDFRHLGAAVPAESFSTAVANPPYVARGAGNLNPKDEKALARHEVSCSLPELARAARRLLKANGSLHVVFPASRLGELMRVLAETGFGAKRLCLVHPHLDRPARLAMVEAVKNGSPALEVLAPLVLFDRPGRSSARAQRLLDEIESTLDAPPVD